MKDTYKSFIVPAGKYWLDDPSFVVQASDDWSAYCTACDHEDMSTEEYKELFKTSPYEALSYQLNGHYVQLPDDTKVLSFSTAGGRNGWYNDQSGVKYHVASGLLGLVPYEYNPTYEVGNGGRLVEFSEETLCFTKDGILTFGSYIIDTAADPYGTDGTEL